MDFKQTIRSGMLEIVAAATIAGLVAEVVPELAKDSKIKYITAALIGTAVGTVAGRALADKVNELRRASRKHAKELKASKVAVSA